MGWGLIAVNGSFSPVHIDSDGMTTIVMGALGSKLWCTMYALDGGSASAPSVLAQFDTAKPHYHLWGMVPLFLEAGDVL